MQLSYDYNAESAGTCNEKRPNSAQTMWFAVDILTTNKGLRKSNCKASAAAPHLLSTPQSLATIAQGWEQQSVKYFALQS